MDYIIAAPESTRLSLTIRPRHSPWSVAIDRAYRLFIVIIRILAAFLVYPPFRTLCVSPQGAGALQTYKSHGQSH